MIRLLTRLLALAALFLLGLLLVGTSPALAASQAAENADLIDTASWALLAGVLTPLVTSFVQQGRWTGPTRTIVGIGASVIVGLLTLLANGTIDDGPQTVLSVLALVVVSSATAYKTIWGREALGVAPKLERATSPASMRDDSNSPHRP